MIPVHLRRRFAPSICLSEDLVNGHVFFSAFSFIQQIRSRNRHALKLIEQLLILSVCLRIVPLGIFGLIRKLDDVGEHQPGVEQRLTDDHIGILPGRGNDRVLPSWRWPPSGCGISFSRRCSTGESALRAAAHLLLQLRTAVSVRPHWSVPAC